MVEMIETPRRPVPVVDDLDTGGFFEAARRGELAIQVCDGCGTVLHLPRAYCRACGSWDTHWQPTSGRGRVYSWTTVDHQVHAAFPVPYTIVLIQLEDVPARLVGHLAGAPELTEGQPMEMWFETLDDGVVVPQWRSTT
jgi:uncharacterized OB-fold protein